ncbi:hypothetical protein [Leifsonia sp. NPDC058230]|uniref:hypothetical protein n=1 Tax=Leifsonia sp. NPDC058230 TaxID=3346391 RepID=UPI0036DE60C1
MRWLTDAGSGAWIGPRLQGWGRVGAVVPRGFEAYARILHPVPATRVAPEPAGAPDDDFGRTAIDEAIWPWAEVARRTGRVVHPLVQWDRIARDDRRLAFDDGWMLGQPRAGFFGPAQLSQLVGALDGHSSTPDNIVFGVWVGWGELNGSRVTVSLWAPDGADGIEAELAAIEAEKAASVSPEVSGAISSLPSVQRTGSARPPFSNCQGESTFSARRHCASSPTRPGRSAQGWAGPATSRARCPSSSGRPTIRGASRRRSIGIPRSSEVPGH